MIWRSRRSLALLLLVPLLLGISFASPENDSHDSEILGAEASPPPRPPLSLPLHSSNYAVIVSSSRYWFNYRHNANALSIYQMLRHYGFPDDHIVLMLADEFAASPRNPVKNGVFNTASDSLQWKTTTVQRASLHNEDTKIDYRGEDVTVENFINVLTGRSDNGVLPVLESDEHSHVLIYLTGHGGDQFFKFQDVEEVTADQLADALHQMHLGRKYRQVLLVADTCQAFTLGDAVTARRIPNVAVIGTSLRGQSSYAHTGNPVVAMSVIEKYTHYFVEHVRNNGENRTMQEQTVYEAMVEPFTKAVLGANVGMGDTNCDRKLTELPLRDFFANVQSKQFWSSETLAPAAAAAVNTEKGNDDTLGSSRARLLPETTIRLSSMPGDGVVGGGGGDQQRHRKTAITAFGSMVVEQGHCSVATPGSIDVGQCAAKRVEARSGMEPSDPVFVLLVVGLLGSVVIASRARW